MLQLLLEQAACRLPNGDVVAQHLRSPRFGALLMLREDRLRPLQHQSRRILQGSHTSRCRAVGISIPNDLALSTLQLPLGRN